MPFRTINGKRVFVHTPSPEHPSGHGATSELDNNLFVTGVKLAQAKERLQDQARKGKKPHEQIARLAGKVQTLQTRHDKLMQKRLKRDG